MTEYWTNDTVEWLLRCSRGQGGIVALPDAASSDVRPTGAFPPGVQDVLDHLCDELADWDSDEQNVDWCFLIGGPGNGKSEALREMAGALGLELPERRPGEPVPRSVPESWPDAGAEIGTGVEIAFINDASVPRGDESPDTEGSLCLDIADALKRTTADDTPTVLFGNVNRGVLIEEYHRLEEREDSLPGRLQAARALIAWLNSPPGDSGELEDTHGDQQARVTQPRRPAAPYYGQWEVSVSAWTVRVHAVFLDELSLLEPSPGGQKDSLHFRGREVEIEDYLPLGGIADEEAVRASKTVAGEFLSQIASEERWEGGGCVDRDSGELCPAHEYCPLANNARWARHEDLRARLLSVFRAAEVAAGRNFTYRDLLANYSRALLGEPEPAWLKSPAGSSTQEESLHPCHWVQDRVKEVEEGNGDRQEGADPSGELLRHRIYTSIFSPLNIERWRDEASPRKAARVFRAAHEEVGRAAESRITDPFLERLEFLDPAKDIESWEGHRREAQDMVEAVDVESPAVQLEEVAGIPEAALSPLERQYDQRLRDELHEEASKGSRASKRRSRLLRLYRGSLLLRQVGLALGFFSHREAIDVWLTEQREALQGSSQQRELEDGVEKLVFPRYRNSSNVIFAPWRPRTYAVEEPLPRESVLQSARGQSLYVDIVPRGDDLYANISVRAGGWGGRGSEEVSSLVVDLAITREALLSKTDHPGSFSEIGERAFARIERARAALINRLSGSEESLLYTDGSRRTRRVTKNPTAPPPYRLQDTST